jgi:hypothetical protein
MHPAVVKDLLGQQTTSVFERYAIRDQTVYVEAIHAPKGCAHFVDLSGETGGEVQQPRRHIAVEEPLREQQRRLGEDIEKAGDREERQVLQVVHLDSPDSLDALVGLRSPSRLAAARNWASLKRRAHAPRMALRPMGQASATSRLPVQ